jgi:FAD/FMN-containing dehydrogenase
VTWVYDADASAIDAMVNATLLTAPPSFRGIFRTDTDARAVYSEGAGIARIVPRAIAVPADAADVQALVHWAQQTGTPLVPRGSGSGMASGGIGDGVIVDLSRIRHISPVDKARRTITVGAGVTRQEADDAARASGLRFPPDPSSGRFCTVGGMVSTNASGAHSLKYGPTRQWVQAIDCVFDDGSRATVRRGQPAPHDIPAIRRFQVIADALIAGESASPSVHAGVLKDSSGYGLHAYSASTDLVDLLVGSEGTLAIVLEVELLLIDVAAGTSSLLAAFATLESAVNAATKARDAGAVACELLDRTFLDVARRGAPLPYVPEDSEAVLLIEVETDRSISAQDAARSLEEMCTASGATTVQLALTPEHEREMWELRHAASPILSTLGPSLTSMQFVEDCAVPPGRLAEYVRGVRAILDEHEVTGVIFGHAGDSHVHVNPLIDVNRTGWRDTVARILEQVVALAASLGGTLDGEHGDGRLRTSLLDQVWPEATLEKFQAIKRAFDPAGIFNPGVKIPVDGEQPIADIKYDPALAPLPHRAAKALKHVTDARAYDSFRLDLLSRAE